MGALLTKDAVQTTSAVSSDLKAYYAALLRRVPKGGIISVSRDGSCDAVIQQPEFGAENQNAVTDLRSLRDALVAQLAH